MEKQKLYNYTTRISETPKRFALYYLVVLMTLISLPSFHKKNNLPRGLQPFESSPNQSYTNQQQRQQYTIRKIKERPNGIQIANRNNIR